MILLNLITFLSAFLLFQIELIVAKLFLPSYGGSYLVWGACVVFFQGALLAGYVLSHRLIELLPQDNVYYAPVYGFSNIKGVPMHGKRLR